MPEKLKIIGKAGTKKPGFGFAKTWQLSEKQNPNLARRPAGQGQERQG
jgi:hypothetical protein